MGWGSPLTLHELELVCPATAHPDVPNQTGLNYIMQCLHRLLDGSVVVEPMALKDVDVV